MRPHVDRLHAGRETHNHGWNVMFDIYRRIGNRTEKRQSVTGLRVHVGVAGPMLRARALCENVTDGVLSVFTHLWLGPLSQLPGFVPCRPESRRRWFHLRAAAVLPAGVGTRQLFER